MVHILVIYFTAAILLRDSLLISISVNQCKIFYNMTQAHINNLELVDSQRLQQLLQTFSKTNVCLMMHKLGLYPLRYTIKSRRLGYLHHLLTRDNDSLVRQVFIQKMPVKGDCTSIVQNDIKELKINMSFTDIFSISKKMFKNIVFFFYFQSLFGP